MRNYQSNHPLVAEAIARFVSSVFLVDLLRRSSNKVIDRSWGGKNVYRLPHSCRQVSHKNEWSFLHQFVASSNDTSSKVGRDTGNLEFEPKGWTVTWPFYGCGIPTSRYFLAVCRCASASRVRSKSGAHAGSA